VVDPDNGYDLAIEGTGTGKARRYGDAQILIESKGPLVYTGQAPDLWKLLAAKVIGYREKAKLLFATYGPFVDYAGFKPSDVGLTAADIK
jgi:hypothetical protein